MMGGTRILTDAQLGQMANLREQGWSCARIAAWFTQRGTALSTGAVSWQCLRIGADLPLSKRRPDLADHGPRVSERGDGIVRRFSEDEDVRLLALEAEGCSFAAMARALGRRNNSIRGRLMTLARRQARQEAACADDQQGGS